MVMVSAAYAKRTFGREGPAHRPRTRMNMRRLTLVAVATMTAAALAGCNILEAHPNAPAPTGTLQGVVTSPSGPVANAQILVTASDATQHAGLSNGDGYYSIASLPLGPASYTVKASGFAEVDGNIVIAPDPGGTRQDISLNPQ